MSNFPPPADPLLDRLSSQYDEMIARAVDLAAAASRVPELLDDPATVDRATSFAKQIKDHRKAVETARRAEGEDFLRAKQTVDGFFRVSIDALDVSARTVERRVQAFLIAKEAQARRQAEADAARLAAEGAAVEAARLEHSARHARPAEFARTRGSMGGVATLHTAWVGELVDRAALDLESLRPFLSDDALAAAIRAFVKAGGRELRGARIHEQKTARVA